MLKSKTNILGSILLLIYSVVMLHNMVPHQHDEYSCPNIHTGETHHHGHDHHHHEHSGWMHSLIHLFSDFNHNGLCLGHYENYLLAELEPKLELPQAFYYVPVLFNEIDVPELEFNSFHTDCGASDPPDLYKDHITKKDPLRGPPELV